MNDEFEMLREVEACCKPIERSRDWRIFQDTTHY